MSEYKLSRTLEGHRADVRGVVFPSSDLIASVSRDGTLRTWKPLPGSAQSTYGVEWTSSVNFESSKYLNSICWMADRSLIASAGVSKEITVTSPNANLSPEYVLKGHEANVCALSYNFGVLISGSWDATARVWIDKTCKYVLRGHQSSVWAVIALAPDKYLTGSADKTIRLWHGGKSVLTFTGHTDVVRGLCQLNEDRFASCSNDGSIRIWNLKGACLSELYGHTSFVYSLTYSHSTGQLASSGEDRSIRIWKDGNCIQTISLPCTSVWAVAVCEDTADIAASGSDGTVRIFSCNETSWATGDEIAKFNQQVAGYAISSSDVGTVNKEKLPGPEALRSPGTKIGQVMMIKTGLSEVDAYQWSGEEWTKIGEVVSAVGQQQKQIYEGKEFDYVFDVDIAEGVPPLKLPYNATENPYNAARRFLEKNELPLEYLDETAKFIETNSGGVQIGQSHGPIDDPYGSRYVPDIKKSIPDTSVRPSSTLFPQKTFLYLKKINATGVLKKGKEVNASTGSLIDESQLGKILLLSNTASLDHPTSLNLASLGMSIMQQWQLGDNLCGLDILRVIIGQVEDKAVTLQIVNTVLSKPEIFKSPNHAMMAVRIFTNLFESDVGKQVIQDEKYQNSILDHAMVMASSSLSSAAAVSLATLLLNFSIFAWQTSDYKLAFSIIGLITEFMRTAKDAESVYRLTIALGTLLSMENWELVEAAQSLDSAKTVEGLSTKFDDTRLKVSINDILALLRSR
ncbi:WD40-repeat-containing domain protein [Lipomyces arxii]|uniref:WD40-repeat-containing domain protein n=1 Tax=Lipomyces arxii TaxID=56418 RepID=UPI0034CFFA18